MRSISNNLYWTSLFVKIYRYIVNNFFSALSPPQTPIQLASLADFFPHCWAWYQAKASKSWPYPWLANHGQNASFSSLRKQPTFGNATTGFLTKWRLRDERRNTTLMMFHYLDLGSDSDWSCHVGNLIQPIRSTTQIWVVTRHQYGISVLISQTSFGRETSCSVAKCWLFSQAIVSVAILLFIIGNSHAFSHCWGWHFHWECLCAGLETFFFC